MWARPLRCALITTLCFPEVTDAYMPVASFRLRMLLGGVLLGAAVVAGPCAAGQFSSPSLASTAAADTSAAVPQPYTTSRGIAHHMLAVPAYILWGVTRPLGWGMRYVEQHFPGLFDPQNASRGVIPLVEVGGSTGFLSGLALYHNGLFGADHSARIQGTYQGPNTFAGEVSYAIPDPAGPGSPVKSLATEVNVFSDADAEFFLGGNASRTADEALFSRNQVDVTVGIDASVPASPLRGGVDLLYEHVEVDNAGQALRSAALPGFDTVDLLTSRLTLGADFTGEAPRVARGTEVILQLDYTHDLTADRFRYGRYVAEVHQYVPVGVFPDSRRLVLRARLEQVGPLLGGAAVPFYQLPGLGGLNALRGFEGRRFQNDGSLLLGGEYRYPIWSNLDATVFVDAGQVFDTLAQVEASRFQWSYGGGIHVLNRKGLNFRVEVAGSRDGPRAILTVEPSYRRVAR